MKGMTRFLNALFLPKDTFQSLQSVGQPPVPLQKGQLLPVSGSTKQTTHCIVSGGTEQERAHVLACTLANSTAPAVVLTNHPHLAGMLGCPMAAADPLAGKSISDAARLLTEAANHLGYATAEWAFQLTRTLKTLQELNGELRLFDFAQTDCAELSAKAFAAGDDWSAEAHCTSAARELERLHLALDSSTIPQHGRSAVQLLRTAHTTVVPVRTAAQAAILLQDFVDAARQRSWEGAETMVVVDLGGALNRRQLEILHDESISSLVLDEDLPSRQELFQAAARGLTAGAFFAHQAGAQALSEFAGRCKRPQVTTTTSTGSSESEWGGGPMGLFGNITTTRGSSTATVLVDEPLIQVQDIHSLPAGVFYYYHNGGFRRCRF